MDIKMISAVSINGVIGKENKIPWSYPEDFKFFRQMTLNQEVIFGRKTFESLPNPLPKRTNTVITRQAEIPGASTFPSLEAWHRSRSLIFEDVKTTKWVCGGANIYREGMKYANDIYLTLIPETIQGDDLIYFPWINPSLFEVNDVFLLNNSPLNVVHYVRK